jgi:hypothetical protein
VAHGKSRGILAHGVTEGLDFGICRLHLAGATAGHGGKPPFRVGVGVLMR